MLSQRGGCEAGRACRVFDWVSSAFDRAGQMSSWFVQSVVDASVRTELLVDDERR